MESIESLNVQLKDLFSVDIVTGQPIWRISWSDSETEKRRMDHTPEGIHLLHPQVFEVKKYPYIRAKYVLERLVLVPEVNEKDLPTQKLSYEPMWVYENPPTMYGTKFIIDTIYAAIQQKPGLKKYMDPDATEETRQARIKQLHEEMFGNETNVGDALAYKEGVTVPRNYGDVK